MAIYIPTIPTENVFDALSNTVDIETTENDVEVETGQDETIEQTLSRVETEVREKIRKSIKKKVDTIVKLGGVTEEFADGLEQELIEDMEETIKEEIKAFRFNLESVRRLDVDYDENNNDDYDSEVELESPRFYWGGDDEMIFYEDSQDTHEDCQTK